VKPLLTESTRLGIGTGELIELIQDCARRQASSDLRGGVAV
jgi:hypothetical protein